MTALMKLNALIIIFIGPAILTPIILQGASLVHRTEFRGWISAILVCLASVLVGACALIWASESAFLWLGRKWGYIWILSLWSWILAAVIIGTNYLRRSEKPGQMFVMINELSLTQIFILMGWTGLLVTGYVCNLGSIAIKVAAGFIERKGRKTVPFTTPSKNES